MFVNLELVDWKQLKEQQFQASDDSNISLNEGDKIQENIFNFPDTEPQIKLYRELLDNTQEQNIKLKKVI